MLKEIPEGRAIVLIEYLHRYMEFIGAETDQMSGNALKFEDKVIEQFDKGPPTGRQSRGITGESQQQFLQDGELLIGRYAWKSNRVIFHQAGCFFEQSLEIVMDLQL